jgi:hypothetical protein
VRTAFLAIALALVLVGPARADIFAVAPVVASGHSDIDVGLIDVSTDTRLALPAGVNTAADEDHPSISADGRRLAFERRDHAAGTTRLIAADRRPARRWTCSTRSPLPRCGQARRRSAGTAAS